MKVTYNWLKDFVEVNIRPPALAEKLTMAGLEVTSLEERDGDCIFEIEVTSNRPDCLSVLGIAREVAAITGKKLKLLQASGFKLQAKNLQRAACSVQPFTIEIEGKKDCPFYSAKIIQGIQVGPSPDWLKRRLELVGCRSANIIVDITNYILFEWGEPLHAFDLDKLVARPHQHKLSQPLTIIVRRARPREEIITIDAVKRVLDNNVLIIASDIHGRAGRDSGIPIAIAGIMGGKDTEVTERTRNILLEAAVFDPVVVRRARQKLGMQSESAYRFERGIDLKIVERASWRAVEMTQGLGGGRCACAKKAGLAKMRKRAVALNTVTVHKVLGAEVKPAQIKKILTSLGFKVKPAKQNNFVVFAPSYRPDVKQEIDLIEEIARLFGYGRIPATSPRVSPQRGILQQQALSILIKNILVGLGLNEVITYALVDNETLKARGLRKEAEAIEILNPPSREQAVLRTTLMPGLSRCVAYNLNQKQSYVNIFEIAKVFSRPGCQIKEELVLGVALCGTKSYLSGHGLIKDEAGLLHLKGILEIMFERMGIREYRFDSNQEAGGADVYIREERVGVIAALQRGLLDKFDIKNKEVVVCELSLDKIASGVNLQKKFVPLPKYPGITRDVSFIVKEAVGAGDILRAIREQGGPFLKDARVTDYYRGKQIPAGFRSLTVSCLYRADERTLIEAEVNPAHAAVCGTLTQRFGAKIRA